jgi:hypothetical protein
MPSTRESNLRLVKPSQDFPEDPGEAEPTIRFPRGTPAPETILTIAKPRALAAVAVEIKHKQIDPAAGTIMGMPAFAAAVQTIPVGGAAPAPAKLEAAIAKVQEEESTSKVRKLPKPVEAPATRTVDPAIAPANDHASDHKWHSFEDIGLAPNKITKGAQKLVVSSYRLLGFGILSVIVLVLLAYIATTAFYFLNHSWLTPATISANDDKVIALQGQLAAQMNERAKLVGELDQADRTIAAEQAFQIQYARAIKRDLDGRRMALGRAQRLARTAAATRDEIRATNGDYSTQTVAKMNNEYDAGLIDRQAMLQGKFQLAQIKSANLSLAERQAEFDQRASDLAAETQSLDAILADKAQTSALSYDVLKIQRDYEASKLALAKDIDDRERAKASVEREDKIIDGLKQSNYLRALADKATVALVPYSNLDKLSKGTPLYGCSLSMVWCHQVGKVIDVLPGEVLVKHPHRDAVLRGRMIEMQMSDNAAAQDEVLFAGGAPLGF